MSLKEEWFVTIEANQLPAGLSSSEMSSRSREKKATPLSVEQLMKKRDQLQEWFRKVRLCCQKEDPLLDQYLQTVSSKEILQPPLNFNVQRTELSQLRVAVDVLQDLSADDDRDLEVFETVWNCVLPWFARTSVGPDAEALLDAFMCRLCSLLSAPRIADVIQAHFDRLTDLPYPDALIELCRNATFARKVHSELVRRFVDGLKRLEVNSDNSNNSDNSKNSERIPLPDAKLKWRCVHLGGLIVDVLQATKIVDDDDFNRKLSNEIATTHVDDKQITIAFYRERSLKLLLEAKTSTAVTVPLS